MLIDREIIEDVRMRSDIVDVIGTYVNLKRAGSNFSGLCPFHSEKTPSFTVFPSTQNFYCFGCNSGGDVITFIMKSENLTYPEAVRTLAARAGITIPDKPGEQDAGGIPRRRILDMNKDAAVFFHNCLMDKTIGRPGMDYLMGKRRLSLATINHFGLGYSPDSFGMLTDYMHKKGYSDQELYTGFLAGKSQKTGRPYDFYRGRVIFPIIDTTGNVIAFGGRIVEGDANGRKYLNTSDTPAFKKGRNLFALNFAKNHCSESMILCEGYMDTIALHSAGFENAVATLGTALTSDQARIMAKYTKQIILMYDSDEAGQRATQKAMPLLADAGLEVRVLKLDGAKDPDEFIRENGADKFRSALNRSSTGFEYKLNNILSKYDIEAPEQKIRAAGDICAEIATVYSSVEREVYINSAAKRLDLSHDSLKRDVERIIAKRARESRVKESRDAQISAKNIGDRINPDSAKNLRANAAEEAILGLMLIYPEYRNAVSKGDPELSGDDFFTAFGKKVFEKIMELEADDGGYDYSLMGEFFTPDEMGRLQMLQQKRRALTENGTEVFRSSVLTLKSEKESISNRESEDKLSAIQKLLESKKQQNVNK